MGASDNGEGGVRASQTQPPGQLWIFILGGPVPVGVLVNPAFRLTRASPTPNIAEISAEKKALLDM